MDIRYRHEWKHELNTADLIVLRSRLRAVMESDPHAVDGKYHIRSLYFDTPDDKALREKLDGVNLREKFRIRLYNRDASVIHLEKKGKRSGLGTKFSADLSAEEAQRIVDGDLDWMLSSGRPLVQELYCKMRYQGMRPKTIVHDLLGRHRQRGGQKRRDPRQGQHLAVHGGVDGLRALQLQDRVRPLRDGKDLEGSGQAVPE